MNKTLTDPSSALPEAVGRLIARIDTAFGSVPRPQITKSVARGLDDYWTLSPDDAAKLRAQDSEQDWREVSAQDTETYQEYFAFADAEGWSFYLPAFLTHDLRRYPHCGANAVFWACQEKERLSHLTATQMACVDAYLTLVKSVAPRP